MTEPPRTFTEFKWPITDEVKGHLKTEYPKLKIIYGEDDANVNGLDGYETFNMAWSPPDTEPFLSNGINPETMEPIEQQVVIRTRIQIRAKFDKKNMYVYSAKPLQAHVPLTA